MKKLCIYLILALFVVSISLTSIGCKGETAVEDEETAVEDKELGTFTVKQEDFNVMPEELIGEKDSFKGIKIGFSQRAIAGSTWWENLVRVAKNEAEWLGAEIQVIDAQGDISRQISDIDTLITQNIDVLIVDPVDSKGILPAIEAAHAANIPVVSVNCNIDPAGAPFTFVGHEIYDFGYSAGFGFGGEVDKIIGNKKEITAAIISGFPAEEYSIQERDGMIAGFAEFYISKYDRLNLNILAHKYGEWSADKALVEMQDVLSVFPEIDMMFTLDGQMLMGCLRALEDAGQIGKTLVLTAGGRKEELKLIKDGDSGVLCTSMVDPRDEAKWAVLLACYKAKGFNVPSVLTVPSLAITEENVDQYYDENSMY